MARWIVRVTLYAMVMLAIFADYLGRAQAQQPPGPAPTCEAQLEEARTAMIQLRREKAQAEFSAATIEGAALAMQKRLAEYDKAKAAVAPKDEKK